MHEFFFVSISDAGLIIGWNGGNHDIPVGSVFTTVQRRQFRKDTEIRFEDAEVVGAVRLTLREVHWYGQTIGMVPRGHSAALEVLGDGLELLVQALRQLEPYQLLWLETSVTNPILDDPPPIRELV